MAVILAYAIATGLIEEVTGSDQATIHPSKYAPPGTLMSKEVVKEASYLQMISLT
jgi:hypothetical protein